MKIIVSNHPVTYYLRIENNWLKLTLTPQFKYELGIIIEGYISRLKEKKPKDLFGIRRVIKYKNYRDFWHGYFLGKIEAQLMHAHFKEFKREMNESERIELDQIIGLFDPIIIEVIEKLEKNS